MKTWVDELQDFDIYMNKKYSQYGEDGIAEFIFSKVQTNKFLVDIGAGGGYSNSKWFLSKGWKGLLYDLSESHLVPLRKEKITQENVVSILSRDNCPKEFGFLNLDIDSFDYDVLEAILNEFVPLVVCSEFNGTLPVGSAIKLFAEKEYEYDGTNKYGYSFGAGVYLFEKYGYTVVMNHINNNIFAVKSEFVPNKPELKPIQTMYHAINNEAIWISVK